MITTILMPKLGLVMKKGRVITWYRSVGEQVKEGEPLFQISTEKVTIDVEAKASGYLRAIYAVPGAIVPVSGIIGLMGDRDESLPDMKPPVYEMDTKGIESAGSAGPARREAQSAASVEGPAQAGTSGEIKASPAAKRLAKEKGVDLAAVRGTGPGGRITESDVLQYKTAGTAAGTGFQTAPTDIPATPYARKLAQERGVSIEQVAQSAGDRKIHAQDVIDASEGAASGAASAVWPLTDMRRAVAERMSYSAHTSAPVTLGMEVVAEELLKLRTALSVSYPSDRITINDLMVKLVAAALRKHPLANASLEEGGIRVYRAINIGIGVAVEGGLLVPAVADADKKGIVQISRESRDLIERAKTGRLTLDELSRGTFTVTNLGAYGIDMFTPIINPPQSATLGVGRIVRKPWVVGEAIAVVSTMVLSLTFDHRVIDGAPAAQCLSTIKQYIENPYMVLGA